MAARVALDYVEDGIWNDSAFLESIRAGAQTLTLASAETRPLSLKMTTAR